MHHLYAPSIKGKIADGNLVQVAKLWFLRPNFLWWFIIPPSFTCMTSILMLDKGWLPMSLSWREEFLHLNETTRGRKNTSSSSSSAWVTAKIKQNKGQFNYMVLAQITQWVLLIWWNGHWVWERLHCAPKYISRLGLGRNKSIFHLKCKWFNVLLCPM